MYIQYNEWTPRKDTLAIVSYAESIIEEYQASGYTLTLRQLYYQFVSRDLIPNTERSYKNLGSVITKARMAGMISWDAIEDRNRTHNGFWYDEDETSAIEDLPRYIRFDRWSRQDTYIEVWVEKESLGSVIARACEPLLVPHMSCKGYLSASEAWRAGRRFKRKVEEGKNCILLHLGDHDPSGIDMTRDNKDRLSIFSESHGIEVKRLALNMDQVDQYSPPPNPAKITDSRASDYIKKFGSSSWELDALNPSVIEELIKNEITQFIDYDLWHEVGEQEEEKKDLLRKLYNNWDDIKEGLE